MYGVVKKLNIDLQQQILQDCTCLLNAAPLYSNYAPRRGIGRRDCSGNCQTCLTGGGLIQAKYKNTSFGSWGYYGRPCGATYVQKHPTTGDPFPSIPASILDICKDVADAYGFEYEAQSAYLSYYPPGSSIGRHQDYEEKVNKPVISISLGEDAIFEFGGFERFGPCEDIILHSGDVFIFGGEHRYCYHSVRKLIPDTRPVDLFTESGRISITIRQYE
ncbi:alpha-ketoglutarate-dependent dioxygenase AlkB [Ktedonospora formicarum]|uniref:Alkylated DNA repair dioxygenase n=1 Tax=Ktedonospora formicarum TaxID=2778364 RepID=A0A8J3I124_9CHLR|nr:alpha-ketoglutarate-dependent dioxygenase AlkB [Ktedonospora formicarum]GHO47369.1 alkylated DNA repair dioxygenase [Ktedonospora formicarum]